MNKIGGVILLKVRASFIVLFIFFVAGIHDLATAEVSPEILLGARGIVSLNINNTSEVDSETASDFSDTSMLISFRQKLYSRYRGQFVLGFQLPDRDSSLDSPFFHQVFLKVEDKSNMLQFGRTRLRSSIIEFPILRDEDTIFFTDVLNPFVTGVNSEDIQYGDVLDVAHVYRQRYWINLYGGHVKEDTDITGDSEEDLRFNSMGVLLQYMVPETQRWNREILDQFGIGFNTFFTDRTGHSGHDEHLKNVFFSAILNIHPDPVHFWDLRHQTIYNPGFSEIGTLSDFTSMTKAKSISLFTSVRYLYRKLESPAFQAALSYGYKDFADLTNNTDQHQIIVNGFYRMGENFDVGVQFQYLKNRGDLRNLFAENETRIQFALVYSVDQLWNDQFDDRESLLNLEHGYIP